MIKKIIPFICLMAMLTGCSDASANTATVSASFYPVYLTALNLTKGTDIEVTTLAKPSTGCLHDYQLTSGDIRSLHNADIFIINGAGMEDGFIEQVIATNENLTIIDSSENTHIIESEECDEHDHEDHHHHENSHIWLDPENVIIQAENIAQALCQWDNANSEIYKANFEEYKTALSQLAELYNDIDSKSSVKAIILNNGFEYLCEPFGIEVAFSIELDENTTTSAKELAEITDSAENGNYIILAPKGEHSAFAKSLSRELNIPIYELDPITYGELNDYDYYIDAMYHNYEVIKEIVE